MAIGDLLQELRKDRGLTQKEIGDMMNLSSATIGAYETNINEPPIENINFFAKFYDVSTDYLLGLTKVRKSLSSFMDGLNIEDSVISVEDIINEITQLSPKNRKVLLTVLNGLAKLD